MFHIEAAVLAATTRCPGKFLCLEDRPDALCRVLAAIEGQRLYIVCGCPEKACPYDELQDGRHVCTCPTRIRIFERYGV